MEQKNTLFWSSRDIEYTVHPPCSILCHRNDLKYVLYSVWVSFFPLVECSKKMSKTQNNVFLFLFFKWIFKLWRVWVLLWPFNPYLSFSVIHSSSPTAFSLAPAPLLPITFMLPNIRPFDFMSHVFHYNSFPVIPFPWSPFHFHYTTPHPAPTHGSFHTQF